MGELRLLLEHQALYGGYFSRYLCAIMANLPGNEAVRELAENLFKELGLGGGNERPHSEIYRDMLVRSGIPMNHAAPLVGTRNLIDSMFRHCRDLNPASGLGALCLGAEALVPALYSDPILAFEAYP